MISDRFDKKVNEDSIKSLLSLIPTRILKQTVIYRGYKQEIEIDILKPLPIPGEGLVIVDEGGRSLDEWLKDHKILKKHNETPTDSNSLIHMFAISLTEVKLYHLNKSSPNFTYYQSLFDNRLFLSSCYDFLDTSLGKNPSLMDKSFLWFFYKLVSSFLYTPVKKNMKELVIKESVDYPIKERGSKDYFTSLFFRIVDAVEEANEEFLIDTTNVNKLSDIKLEPNLNRRIRSWDREGG